MARCRDCPEPPPPPVQRAIRWRAWYIGGKVYEGSLADWAALPEDGMLAVKVYFSDGTSRNCNGNDWYGLLSISSESWTIEGWTIIHNNNDDNAERYPNAQFKRGQWTTEEEMNAVVSQMSEA